MKSASAIILSSAADWDDWYITLKAKLRRKKCWNAADPELPEKEQGSVTRDQKDDAYGYIIETIDRSLMGIIRSVEDDDPRTIVNKLRDRFFLKAPSNMMSLRDELVALRLAPGEPVDELIDKIATICRKLESQGSKVTNDEKSATLMRALPPTYSVLRAQLNAQGATSTEPLEYTAICDAVRIYETSLNTNDNPRNGEAFHAQTGKWCDNCRMSNHNTSECRRGKGNRKNCGYCKKPGHTEDECRTKKRKLRDIECHGCGKKGHYKRDCPNPKRSEADAIAYFTDAPITFILDTGSDKHIIKDRNAMTITRETAGNVRGVGGAIASVATGTVKGLPGAAVLAPNAPENLISIKQLCNHGWTATFNGNTAILRDNKGRTLQGESSYSNNLYCFETATAFIADTNGNDGTTDMMKWHAILGHPSDKRLREACTSYTDTSKWPEQLPVCEACIKAKATKAPVVHTVTHEEQDAKLSKGARFDVDLVGPLPSLGKPFYLQAVDRRTRMKFTYGITKKSEAAKAMATLLDRELVPFGRICERIHADRGGEFTGNEWKTMCNERGIRYTYASPDTPAHNGLAERAHRTVNEIARTMLIDADLPANKYIHAALRHATWIANAMPTTGLRDATSPYESWTGRKPNLDGLHPFGSRTFYLNSGDGKFGKRATKGIYLGPSTETTGGAACIWNPETGHMVITRDYKIIPRNPTPPAATTPPQAIQIESDTDFESDEDDNTGDELEGESKEDEPRTPEANRKRHASNTPVSNHEERKQKAKQRAANKLRINMTGWAAEDLPPAWAGSNDTTALLAISDEPTSYREAMDGAYADDWAASMRDELQSLMKQEVWQVIERQPGMRTITGKWAYKIKMDERNNPVRFKSRLVARGFTQLPGVDFDTTSSPVISKEAVRTALAVLAQRGWDMQQFDVNTAYLNATLDKDIYMEPPAGYIELWGDQVNKQQLESLRKGNSVLHLKKALYGLRQSGRRWYETFRDYLREECNLKASETEPCLFVGDDIILLIYVDDGLIGAANEKKANDLMKKLERRFDIKRLGFPRHFLGWTLAKNKNGDLFVNQQGYIERMTKQHGPLGYKSTPMAYGADLPTDGPEGDSALYREIIGSLLFTSISTRPDITTAVSILSRHMESPTKAHITAARSVIAYLSSVADMGLRFKAEGEPVITVYSDASFAPDEHNRRSRSGWVVLVNDTPVAWRSGLQQLIAHSTAESEYIALSDAAREAIYIQRLLHDMGCDTTPPITMYEDNQVAKRMVEEVATKRSKHIDIRYHHLRELVANGQVKIIDCRTQDMVADILTKPLPKDTFLRMRARLVAKGEC